MIQTGPSAPAETAYNRLADLALRPPSLPPLVANFAPTVREGALFYLSGRGPAHAGG